MKKVIALIAAVLAAVTFQACGDINVVKGNGNTDTNRPYTVSVDGNATYTNNGAGLSDPYYGDATYYSNAPQQECEDSGYFYCTVIHKCLNQPLTGGSCE